MAHRLSCINHPHWINQLLGEFISNSFISLCGVSRTTKPTSAAGDSRDTLIPSSRYLVVPTLASRPAPDDNDV